MTHGAKFTPIDFTSRENRIKLEKTIQRQLEYGRKMTHTRITVLSKVDPFTYIPQQPLIEGCDLSAPNRQTMVQLMLVATITKDRRVIRSPVEKVVIEEHQAVIGLYSHKRDASLLIEFTKIFTTVIPSWVEGTGCTNIKQVEADAE